MSETREAGGTAARAAMIAHDTKTAALGEETSTAAAREAYAHRTAEREREDADRLEAKGYGGSGACAKKAEEAAAAATETRIRAEAAYEAHEAGYGGWKRYWHCTSSIGHTHATMGCSTCYSTTTFCWMPALAGMTAAELIETIGETACTTCFPSAPTMKGYEDGTSGLARMGAAEKAAKDTEKAEKAAAKAAKAITCPDGSPLRESGWRDDKPGTGSTIKTLVSARRMLTECLWDAVWYGDEGAHSAARKIAQAHYLAEAIAAKIGEPAEHILGEHLIKAHKKLKRDGHYSR